MKLAFRPFLSFWKMPTKEVWFSGGTVSSFEKKRDDKKEDELLKTQEKARVHIYQPPPARAGCDTRSIFKRGLTGLNSEFSFS